MSKAAKRKNRKGRPRLPGAREANGRLSRAKAHVAEREEQTEKAAVEVAVRGRMRVFGISYEEARGQDGGTVIGRMLLAKEIDRDQHNAAVWYLEARNRYHAAIGVSSDTGVAPRSEVASDGDFVQFCTAAKAKWQEVRGVIQDVMTEMRSPAPASALDHFLIRDIYMPELLGDLRIALNALHRHFMKGERKMRRAA